jgi:hypothetical protein
MSAHLPHVLQLHCSPTCEPCRDKLVSSADGGAQTAGGVGLFFSFTEVSCVCKFLILEFV